MKKNISIQFNTQNKKTTILCLVFMLLGLIFPFTIFAQTEQEPEVVQIQDEPEETEPNQDGSELPAESPPDQDGTELPAESMGTPSILIVTFGPLGILNTQTNSAPSPILFKIGAGAQIKLTQNVSLTPHGKFFGSYYLWEDGHVLPAEIENRTAYVPSIMVDIPVTYDIYAGDSIFRIGISPSVLLRFAALATSVPESEKPNIDEMNRWFWQNGRFFYPSLQFSWDYIFDSGVAVGLGAKAYFSVGGFLDNSNLDGSMINLSVRLIPPAW